jgi:hypothetical protein
MLWLSQVFENVNIADALEKYAILKALKFFSKLTKDGKRIFLLGLNALTVQSMPV